MNRDDIIRMAREAGICTDGHPMNPWNVYPSDLERFANLVAAATRESMKSEGWRACAVGQRTTQHCGLLETAVLVEREACARVCEDGIVTHKGERILHGVDCAAAIRARGDK